MIIILGNRIVTASEATTPQTECEDIWRRRVRRSNEVSLGFSGRETISLSPVHGVNLQLDCLFRFVC